MVLTRSRLARAALALAAALLPVAALAQALPQPQVTTQPLNDNSPRAASTAYVDRATQGITSGLAINASAILAEQTRAKAVEAGLLPLTGGMMSGGLGCASGATCDVSGLSALSSGANVSRTLAAWMGDRANVRAFAGADLSAQFAAACASLPTSGGTIYMPGGTYASNGALVCNGKPVSVIGDGPGVTVVNFTSAAAGAAGLSLAPGDQLRPITVKDFSFITVVNQAAGNAAITIRYASALSNIFKGPKIENVELAGAGNNTTYWGKGIDAYNVWGFDFHHINIRGKDVGSATSFPGGTSAAISITGENGGGCSDGKITSVNAIFVGFVGYVSGDCEGLHWTNNTGVAVDQGITYTGGLGYPGFFIYGNHFNSFRYGVNIAGWQQGMIFDNLLYKWAASAQNWIGVAFASFTSNGTSYGSNGNQAHNNTIYGYYGASAGGLATGFAAIGQDGNLIKSNLFVLMDYGFDFGGSTTANVARDNSAVSFNPAGGWQKNIGTNTISSNNTPVAVGADLLIVTFGPGVTTFNVGAWFQRVFYTNNPSAAVTMTDLTNAEAGRQITIIAQDANTTIANNARIHLKGSAGMTMASGASLTLLYTGQFWQEIGRSQ